VDNFSKYLHNAQYDAQIQKLDAFSGGDLEQIARVAARQGMSPWQYLQSRVSGPVSVMKSAEGRERVQAMGHNEAAVINFQITRTLTAGAAFAGTLPAILGLPHLRENDYQQILFEFIAAALGITGVTVARNGNGLLFTFTDGVNTETINIQCSDTPYNAFVPGLFTTYLKYTNLRYRVAAGDEAQYNNVIHYVSRSVLGKTSDNPLTPANYLNPNQQQNNVVDIPEIGNMGSSNGLVIDVGTGINGQQTVTLMIESFSRGVE